MTHLLETAADTAAEEAVGWSALCDQFALNAIRFDLQLTETRHRSALIEEECSHRVFFYNSLLFGITGQAARLAAHFTTLMDDVSALQQNHERLQAEKHSHTHQIQEYHAKMILEHRSQAEAQAQTFQNKIENLRADERDLRSRVEALRHEAEESYAQLEKRRNDSLEERRHMETELQRLQSEVSNQKYFLERINAQVEAAKLKLREVERNAQEVQQQTQLYGGAGGVSSRRISPPNGAAAAATPSFTQADQLHLSGASSTARHHSSPSPDRHGDSIASGLTHVRAIRDAGIDEQFVKYGRTAGTPGRYSPITVGGGSAAAQPLSSSSVSNNGGGGFAPVALSSGHSQQQQYRSSPARAQLPPSGYGGYSSSAASFTSPPPPAGSALRHQQHQQQQQYGTPGGSFSNNNNSSSSSSTISSRGGIVVDQTAPSQWQIRLMKLQGELKSLKTDLGVASPQQNQQLQQQAVQHQQLQRF